ncbi:HIT family protein [bacterium]|nr:HIT family protein [bacterium]
MATAPTCPFCAVIAGDDPDNVVYRDERIVAFLDHRPLFPGHVLVVPVIHVQTLGDLPGELFAPLMRVVKAASRAMESGLGAQGSFIAQNNRVSQSVPHLHVHVVPRTKGDGLKGFFWPRTGYRDEAQRAEIATRLAQVIARELDA